jgi:hypothetical protein
VSTTSFLDLSISLAPQEPLKDTPGRPSALTDLLTGLIKSSPPCAPSGSTTARKGVEEAGGRGRDGFRGLYVPFESSEASFRAGASVDKSKERLSLVVPRSTAMAQLTVEQQATYDTLTSFGFPDTALLRRAALVRPFPFPSSFSSIQPQLTSFSPSCCNRNTTGTSRKLQTGSSPSRCPPPSWAHSSTREMFLLLLSRRTGRS